MSEPLTTAALPQNDPEIAAIRTKLIGCRITIAQAAAAFGVTERSIYNAIESAHVPFVKVFGVRYMDPDDLRRALVKDHNSAPRGRGRPRKAA